MTPDITPKDEQFLQSYGLTARSEIAFFTRQPALLLTYMVLSLGSYGLYWFYRNWDAVRVASGHKMLPLLRAIFAIFYAWPLFKIMILQARERGFDQNYSGGALALGYLVPNILAGLNSSGSDMQDDTFLATEIVVAIISVCMLLLAQHAVIYNNPLKRTTMHSPVTKFEVFFIILVCVLPIVLNLSVYNQ